MKALYLMDQIPNISDLEFELVDLPQPTVKENDCLIKVAGSGINPSDALATTGYFKHAVVPRILGRDFSGTVEKGPMGMEGKKVWGTGGAAGIATNGTHAEYITLPSNALSTIPSTLDLLTAAAQPLPYVTAYYGLAKRAVIQPNDTVLVVGALGQVGQAAMSICRWKGANPIAMVRGEGDVKHAQQLGWQAINSEQSALDQAILALNHGKPVDIIFNSVGNMYWHTFMSVLGEFGRIVTISARENTREALVNLFDLYRGNQEIIGVNTVSFDFAENAVFLDELREGFENGKLQPLEISSKTYTLKNASEAYKDVMKGMEQRVVIQF
jgi:NADPH2:quinone reductase